jgi:putative ABC transport system substrate-binding protein
MRRREFIGGLGGMAAAWPLAAWAQQPAMPVIGYLDSGRPGARPQLMAAFRKGLSEVGYVEGRDVAIEFRWAHDVRNRLPELAADLVRLHVNVITITADGGAALVAKQSTAEIPIVFGSALDPVRTGLVASLNRPGGNVTGITNISLELTAKRFALFSELLPDAVHFATLTEELEDPDYMNSLVAELQFAASAVHKQVEVLTAKTTLEIESAFASFPQKQTDGLLLANSPLFAGRRVEIVTLAEHHRIPVFYPDGQWADAGGLISYSASFTDQARLVGIYTGRILKGEKPADLPVMRPTKFELVINLKTAKALGLAIPETLLATADRVIE